MDKLDSRALVGVINTYWPCEFDDYSVPFVKTTFLKAKLLLMLFCFL